MCKRKGVKNEWVNNVIIRFFGKKKEKAFLSPGVSDIYFIYSALYIYLYRSKKDPRSLTKNIQQTWEYGMNDEF